MSIVDERQRAPFDNPDVRNAIKYAINREEIVQKVFLRPRHARQRQPDRADVKFAHRSGAKHVYDPDKVKCLLKKAGVENLKIDLSVADAAFTGAVDAALLCAGAGQGGRASTST